MHELFFFFFKCQISYVQTSTYTGTKELYGYTLLHTFKLHTAVIIFFQIKFIAVNDNLQVIYEEAVRFDSDLPHYKYIWFLELFLCMPSFLSVIF